MDAYRAALEVFRGADASCDVGSAERNLDRAEALLVERRGSSAAESGAGPSNDLPAIRHSQSCVGAMRVTASVVPCMQVESSATVPQTQASAPGARPARSPASV